jgi:hypothetical protein
MRRTKGFLRAAARFDSTAGRLSLRRVATRQLFQPRCTYPVSKPTERNMWTMACAAALALSAMVISNSAQSEGYGIHVFESSYGLPGRVIQVTGLIAARCEGRYRCAFPVRNDFFGGDPIIGPRKQVVVYWTCGGGRNRSVFPEYTEASLSC